MDAKVFGTFVSQCRKELGLTQAQLAERLNVTDKAVSRWERGIGFPDINLLEPLAKELNLTITELMQSERNSVESVSVGAVNTIVAQTLELVQEQNQKMISKYKKTVNWCGRILIVLGIVLFLGLVIFQLVHCVDMWYDEGKRNNFDAFLQYFFSFSKGALLIGSIAGMVPSLLGFFLCKKSEESIKISNNKKTTR